MAWSSCVQHGMVIKSSQVNEPTFRQNLPSRRLRRARPPHHVKNCAQCNARISAGSPRNASGAQAEAASAAISSRHQLRHAILGRSPRAARVTRAKPCKNRKTFLMLSSSLACCQVKEKNEDHRPRLVRPLISARPAPAKTSTDLTSSRLEPVNKSNQVN